MNHHIGRWMAALGIASLLATGISGAASASSENRQNEKPVAGTTPAVQTFTDTVRETASGLPDHTVYRPANLSAFGPASLPVIVWGNGACRNSNWGFMSTLTLLASRGFVVIAVGAPGAPAVEGSGGSPKPERLTAAIDWAESNNKSVFRNRLDLSKVATAGQSCGGLEALVAGTDSRVKSVAALNSGFFATPYGGYGRENLADLKAPTLFVNGGPTDVAYQNSIDNYNLATVPSALVENSHAGHSGLWYGIRDGVGDTLMVTAGADLLTNWLDYTLNDNAYAKKTLIGDDCTLCTLPDWKVQTKGF